MDLQIKVDCRIECLIKKENTDFSRSTIGSKKNREPLITGPWPLRVSAGVVRRAAYSLIISISRFQEIRSIER